MATNSEFLKDPGATLNYGFDWSSWLDEGETIVDSEMSVTTGLTVHSASNSLSSATVWLTGGTSGHIYKVTNKITTNQGRIDRRSITIRVTNR